MSILWERTTGGTLYQVRQAGRSMRLYTNGVLHSQYNPGRPLTGSVWDLLFLPAFFYPPSSIRRVLVLGVGGGAVIQQLRQFVQPDIVVGIELNPVHLSVARRFFTVKGKGVQLIKANAVDWIKQYQGPPFDIIIDDLFGDADGEPQRAVFAGPAWVRSLTRCLSREGMIVSNFASKLELMVSAYLDNSPAGRTFDSAFHLSTAQNYNAVGVFLNRPATTRQLRDRLRKVPQIDPRRRAPRLNYNIRTLQMADRKHD
jgi:spermidine synthase